MKRNEPFSGLSQRQTPENLMLLTSRKGKILKLMKKLWPTIGKIGDIKDILFNKKTAASFSFPLSVRPF
jgi:hypothetical protein